MEFCNGPYRCHPCRPGLFRPRHRCTGASCRRRLELGVVGLFNFDLVAAVFGDMSVVSRIVYVVVGLAAVYAVVLLPRLARTA